MEEEDEAACHAVRKAAMIDHNVLLISYCISCLFFSSGPASSTFEMIEKLFLNGADVFRLNFSHGEHAQKKELLDIIRQVEAKYEHPIAILGDLQGPKLRVGQFANPEGEMLQTGQAFRFDLDETLGTNERVLLPHPEIIEASEVGHELLVDDGKVKLEVTGTGPGYIDCKVGKYKQHE